jgi:hypothetical protein
VRAGCSIILAYLFCVLAPSFALAFGAPFPCLTDEVQPAAAAHAHAASMQMAHAEGVAHDHAAHDHGGMHMHRAAGAAEPDAKHSHDGKNAPGPWAVLRADVRIGAAGRSSIRRCSLAPDRHASFRGSSEPAERGAYAPLSSPHRLIVR